MKILKQRHKEECALDDSGMKLNAKDFYESYLEDSPTKKGVDLITKFEVDTNPVERDIEFSRTGLEIFAEGGSGLKIAKVEIEEGLSVDESGEDASDAKTCGVGSERDRSDDIVRIKKNGDGKDLSIGEGLG